MLQEIHPRGPGLSRIIAGAWRWNNLSTKELDTIIRSSMDLGITTFDHADIYGDYSNEELFGNALQNEHAMKLRMQIVTKCGIKLLSSKQPAHRIKHYDTSKTHVILSVENSLMRLNVEKIDLLLIHRPNPLMNVDEVAEAFAQLRQRGKVLHFGVSNFTPSQFDLLQSALTVPLVTNQLELSLFSEKSFFDGTIDHLYRNKVSPMAWSPLGGGKLLDANHENGRKINAEADVLLQKYSVSLPQLLLAWLLAHPAKIFPVVGTGKAPRLAEAAESLAISLDQQDWFQMLKWVRGADVP